MELSPSKIRRVLRIAQEPISLQTPVGEEEESTLGDFLVDSRMVSPSEAVINLNLREQTAEVLKTLSPREEKIVKMRFGLQDGSEHTLEEVGQSFAVTASAFGRSKRRRYASCVIPAAVIVCGTSSITALFLTGMADIEVAVPTPVHPVTPPKKVPKPKTAIGAERRE